MCFCVKYMEFCTVEVTMENRGFLKLLAVVLSVMTLFLSVAVPGVASDTESELSDLIAYYSFDDISEGVLPDRSGNGHNGTLSGNASVTGGKLGTAVQFSNTGDCVVVPHSEELNFAETDDYTISLWVRPEALDTAWQCVITKNRATNPARAYLGFWFSGSSFAYCQGSDGSSWFDSPRYSGAVNDSWYNVVMVQDAAAGTSTMYVDGVMVVERAYTKPCSGTTALYMGNADGVSLNQFYGSLDEVKIYSSAKSAAEVAEAYAADTAKADSTVAYWDFEDIEGTTLSDKSGNGHNGTISGAVTSVSGRMGDGVQFSESGDLITVPHSADFNFTETDSYSISLWMKPTDTAAQQCVINKGRQSSNGSYNGLWVQHNQILYSSGFYNDGTSTTYYDVRYSTTQANVWYHVVMVQDAELGKSLLYVNGELAGEKTYTRAVTGTDNLLMGNVWANGSSPFAGILDEVRIEKRAMGSAEVSLAYDTVVGNDLAFYYSFDDVTETTVPDSSLGKNDGTVVGTPTVQGNGKVGNAMFITDDGDGFTVSDKDEFDFAATDSYTLTAWIKADSFGGWRSIVNKNRAEASQYFGLFLNGSSLTYAMGVQTVGGNKAWPALSATITAGEWYHVALVQDGESGKCYLYLDGELKASMDAAYGFSGSTAWEIGGRLSESKEYFKGGIDELKLYNLAVSADEIKSEYEAQETANPDYAKYTGVWPTLTEGEVPNIILDMDLGGDSDDLGAIAITYYYHQQGLINLLATTTPRQIWYAGAMSAINTYYGYPDMPMGFNGNEYNDFSYAAYGRYLSTHFSNPLIDKMQYENSVDVMRKILASAEDNSVTFCVTGTYTNLYNLLRSPADEYSDLSGYDLVKQKVKWVIAMGCQYPEGREANIMNDVAASAYVNTNWPTPIVYSTWEIGNPVMTASRETLDKMEVNNPIRAGYEEHYKNLGYGIPRNSWDPITAYFACGGFDTYYDLHRADVAIDGLGQNTFYDNETTGARAYLTKKEGVTDEQMAVVLDDIMVAAEGRIENGVICDYVEDTDTRLIKQSTDFSTNTVTHNLWNHVWYDTYYRSEDVGASVELKFVGESLVIYGGYLPTGGIADIYLDGEYITSVDTYRSTQSLSSYLYHTDGLAEREHTLKIVTAETKNAASAGNTFLLDFIKVDTVDLQIGDVNLDGNVDICDLVKLENIISGETANAAADLNSDGTVDRLDSAALRKLIIS